MQVGELGLELDDRIVGAGNVTSAAGAGAMGARQLGNPLTVREHQPGCTQPARDCGGARGAAGRGGGRRVEHVAAVHGDHQRDIA